MGGRIVDVLGAVVSGFICLEARARGYNELNALVHWKVVCVCGVLPLLRRLIGSLVFIGGCFPAFIVGTWK